MNIAEIEIELREQFDRKVKKRATELGAELDSNLKLLKNAPTGIERISFVGNGTFFLFADTFKGNMKTLQ